MLWWDLWKVKSRNDATRIAAIKRLGAYPSVAKERHIRALMKAADSDPNESARACACEALGALLVLDDPAAVVWGLRNSNTSIAAGLLKGVLDESPEVVYGALTAIDKCLDCSHVPLQVEIREGLLVSEKVDRFRTLLRSSGSSSAESVLRKLLGDTAVDEFRRTPEEQNGPAVSTLDLTAGKDLLLVYTSIRDGKLGELPDMDGLALVSLLVALKTCDFGDLPAVLDALATVGDAQAFEAVIDLIDELKPAIGSVQGIYDDAKSESLSTEYLLMLYWAIQKKPDLTFRCFNGVFIGFFRQITEGNIGDGMKIPLSPLIMPLVSLLFKSLDTLRSIEKSDRTRDSDGTLASRFEKIESEIVAAALRLGAKEVSGDEESSTAPTA